METSEGIMNWYICCYELHRKAKKYLQCSYGK